jgi:peptidoglycan/LPS O-acetylase OafA/YrhL
VPSARSHIAGLDIVRGIAIALVMLRHAAPDIFDGAGIVGVVMFFALSGYLITGTLVGSLDRRGRVDYKRFYINRALRLLPAMLTMLAIFVAVELIVGPENGPGQLIIAALVAGLYLQDLYLADVMPTLTYPGLNGLWTLAIEEQFYLLWPALLTVFVRRRMLQVGVWATAIVCVLTCALTLVVAAAFSTPSALYSLPTTWAVALVLGGAAYIHRDRLERTRASVPLALAAAVILAAFSVLPDAKGQAITYLVGGALIALCTIAIIAVTRTWQTSPTKALEPIRALGVVSYGAYLWNTGPSTASASAAGSPSRSPSSSRPPAGGSSRGDSCSSRIASPPVLTSTKRNDQAPWRRGDGEG